MLRAFFHQALRANPVRAILSALPARGINLTLQWLSKLVVSTSPTGWLVQGVRRRRNSDIDGSAFAQLQHSLALSPENVGHLG